MTDFAKLTADGDHFVADGDATVVPKLTGGPEGADRNKRAWGFVKGLQPFRIVFETDDGSRKVLVKGTGNSKPDRFTGLWVRVRATQDMEQPTEAEPVEKAEL